MFQLERDRYLREFSTFGIGGPIQLFAAISSIQQMEEAFTFIRTEKIPYLIIGKGSNCLFDDRGFKGLVLLNKIDFCEYDQLRVTAGAGFSFSLLGVHTARKGLSGLEFASGIPATVGGSVFMNAGANGQDVANCLESVLYLTEEGEKIVVNKQEFSFSYRTSSFQQMRGAILSATFLLHSEQTARPTQLKILGYRLKTQPYKEKSAGCIFRNPAPDLPAGLLIDQCGLKGLCVGDARVSEMHANFIVNGGKARAEDVLALISKIRSQVAEKTGVLLEPEVRVIHE